MNTIRPTGAGAERLPNRLRAALGIVATALVIVACVHAAAPASAMGASIAGRVTTGELGIHYGRVMVWESGPTGWVIRGVYSTDAQGYYSVADLNPGTYALEYSRLFGDYLTPLREFSGDAPSLELATPITLTDGSAIEGVDAEVLIDPYRAAGADRYATAVAASAATFPPKRTQTVVLTTGAGFADALCASALAGAVDGPILLVSRYAAPQAVLQEIRRLGATKSYVVGGSDVVDDSVARAIDALPGMATPTRLAGITRYQTSVKVAEEVARLEGGSFPREAFVARGDTFPDALSAGPFAYDQHMPVLLTRPDELPAETALCIESLNITSTIICGSDNAVSAGVQSAIEALDSEAVTTTRRGGFSRFDTSASIAMLGMERGWLPRDYNGYAAAPTFGYATGLNFPDALAGASTLGARHGCLLLVETNSLPNPIAGFLATHLQSPTYQYPDTLVLGDQGVVSNWVMTSIYYALQPASTPGPAAQ